MGIQSDVGIALKDEAAAILADVKIPGAESVLDWLEKSCDERKSSDDGELYVFRNWKWYKDDYPDLKALYEALSALDADSYLVVEACFDYPESEAGDAGDWVDNPWGLCREIQVSLVINEQCEPNQP